MANDNNCRSFHNGVTQCELEKGHKGKHMAGSLIWKYPNDREIEREMVKSMPGAPVAGRNVSKKLEKVPKEPLWTTRKGIL